MSRDESIQQQREREARQAKEALPAIVEGLRNAKESLTIASEISEELDLELKQAYRWTEYIAAAFEKRRRRAAIRGAVMLWIGFAALVGTVALVLFGSGPGPTGWVLAVGGLLFVGYGIYLSVTARARTTVPEDLFD